MKTGFQYQLDSSSKKFICPMCGKRRFVRYIDQATVNYLPEKYGICDRSINCGYSLNPYKDGFGKTYEAAAGSHWTPPQQQPLQPSFIDQAILRASLTGYHQNNFIKWLQSKFDDQIISQLTDRYKIGTSKHWPGASVFWQIDQSGNVRSGKIMGYDAKTGHRIKEPIPQITWVHKAMKIEDFNLKQCYYGEHLLKLEPFKAVSIVESEKTAILASAYLPKFVWLAAGSLSNLTIEKFESLSGQNVVLWPDLGCFDKWSKKAEELKRAFPNINIKVSDLLEIHASPEEKKNGLDLADYLEKFDYREFSEKSVEPEPASAKVRPKPEPVIEVNQPKSSLTMNYLKVPERLRDENWEQEITELEGFFNSIELPTEPIKINKWSTITDLTRNLESEFATVKANNGKRTFLPALNRLKELKEYLTAN